MPLENHVQNYPNKVFESNARLTMFWLYELTKFSRVVSVHSRSRHLRAKVWGGSCENGGKTEGGVVIYLRVNYLPSRITKQDILLQKVCFRYGKIFENLCERRTWNLEQFITCCDKPAWKSREKECFFKAFKQRNKKRPTDNFCTDCILSCLKKRTYTARLPTNYRCLPSFATVSRAFNSVTFFSWRTWIGPCPFLEEERTGDFI